MAFKIEKNFYYDTKNEQHKRLFDKEEWNNLIQEWKVVLLKENETIRKGRKKYTWEFILQK